jgi:hypothetical protein
MAGDGHAEALLPAAVRRDRLIKSAGKLRPGPMTALQPWTTSFWSFEAGVGHRRLVMLPGTRRVRSWCNLCRMLFVPVSLCLHGSDRPCEQEVRKRHREYMIKFHPDKAPANEVTSTQRRRV